MTAKQAIWELEQIKQYCTARAIPAVDYAIRILREHEEAPEDK